MMLRVRSLGSGRASAFHHDGCIEGCSSKELDTCRCIF